MKESFVIRGARVVTPGRDLGVVDVRVSEGRVAAVGAGAAPRVGDDVLEADGLPLLPGFVDIHSHGRGGFDFCDATDEAFSAIGRGKLADIFLVICQTDAVTLLQKDNKFQHVYGIQSQAACAKEGGLGVDVLWSHILQIKYFYNLFFQF